MILITHIAVALASLIFTSYLWFSPTKAKFYVSYGLIAGTLASGTILVVSTGSHLLSACASGLAYLAAASTLLALAKRKTHQ